MVSESLAFGLTIVPVVVGLLVLLVGEAMGGSEAFIIGGGVVVLLGVGGMTALIASLDG